MAKADLTAARLREVLVYDPETGIFRWRLRLSNRVRIGEVAGTLAKNGYLSISIDRTLFYAHRLAWFYVHGVWPALDIDHLNGHRIDNAAANLRCVSRQTNAENRQCSKTAGRLLGTRVERSGRWGAQIKVSGKHTHLGTFDTEEQAHAAYLTAKRRLHQGCTI